MRSETLIIIITLCCISKVEEKAFNMNRTPFFETQAANKQLNNTPSVLIIMQK